MPRVLIHRGISADPIAIEEIGLFDFEVTPLIGDRISVLKDGQEAICEVFEFSHGFIPSLGKYIPCITVKDLEVGTIDAGTTIPKGSL